MEITLRKHNFVATEEKVVTWKVRVTDDTVILKFVNEQIRTPTVGKPDLIYDKLISDKNNRTFLHTEVCTASFTLISWLNNFKRKGDTL